MLSKADFYKKNLQKQGLRTCATFAQMYGENVLLYFATVVQ